ncbi:hypothetical protein H4582DRAFT_287690 [Lactarius indigo]|nr:hypothetical protein H4582DRAFT_287690 [Lactarius indigo]
MKLRSSHAPTPTPAPLVQSSHLAGFKFATIGQNPTLLARMSDNVHVTLPSPSPEQELSQDRSGSSHSFSRQGLSQSLTTMERDSPMNSTAQHHLKSWGSTPMSSTPSESHDVKFPHFDQRRTPVVPDLQYPNVAPDNASWPSIAEQSAPMDQDSLPRHQPSMPRNSAVTSVPVGGGGFPNGVMDVPAPSPPTFPQRSRSLASTEPEQLRRPVEHLIKLASVREERMSRQREIFDLRSGELSTFSQEASRATEAVQDQIELVKLQAEEMRMQAGQMLQEATKTRELADRLIASVDALNAPNARTHVDHLVERSDQMSSFMRKVFDWLDTLRAREQEKVNDIQRELDEQALAEINRLAKIQEQQRLLDAERRKRAEAEAEEKRQAARREEEEREAAKKKAEEEKEAARKKAEEEEAARKKAYEEQRAAVLEQKRRATEAQAQKIQRERRPFNDAGGGSNAPPTVFPGIASEHTNNTRASTSLSVPPVVPGSIRSPARSRGPLEVTAPLSQPPPSPNKAKTVPPSVWFVPAQTEVGRTVNTDSPLSSTTLASELHPRTVEASQRPPMNHLTHAAAQDQMLRQESRRMTPMLEQQRVEIKREPSVEELPATRLQASPSRASSGMADMDDARQRHLAIPRRTPSQDRNGDQRNQAPSAPGANSLYVAQVEENRRRSDPSAPVPPEQGNLIHSQDSLHDRPVQGTDMRDYHRQGSTSSDRSPPRWNDRDRRSRSRSRSPFPRRPLSRSPSPYTRKRLRSGSPRYDTRQAPDYWKAPRSQWRARPDRAHTVADRDRGRDREFYDYDRDRHGDSPRRYRPPPSRRAADTYRPSHSPAPPSPRQYRPSPRPGYRDRSPSPDHETQRFAGRDAQDRESERVNTNARHYQTTYETEVRHNVERDAQQRWQRPTPSPSDRDRTPTPPPRLAEAAEVGLLDRIDMNATEDRGRGRGRVPHGATRGGPNPRRGLRGGVSGGRGRGTVSGSTPALLSRMTGTTIHGTRPTHAPSLSDRMQQD